jgi:hypothetical protein
MKEIGKSCDSGIQIPHGCLSHDDQISLIRHVGMKFQLEGVVLE